LEQQLAELREAVGVVPGRGASRHRRGPTDRGPRGALNKDYMSPGMFQTDVKMLPQWMSTNDSDQGSLYEDSVYEEDTITADDLEDRDGHVFEGSVWDCSVFVGIDCLGDMVSLSLALLIFCNIVVQTAFCYLIYFYMLNDPVDSSTLEGLLRFRTSEAHSALYADRVRQRSLAEQVCDLDSGLHWANSQVELLANTRAAMAVGTCLCLLATACWLATLLKEAMDTVHFTRALTLRLGHHTVLTAVGDEVVLAKISVTRFFWVFMVVVIPRLFIVAFLLPTGMSYLCHTISPSELVLNAMALTFIIQIDEMFYEAFAPRRVKCLVRNMKPMPVAALGVGRKMGGAFATFRLLLLLIGIIGSYIFLVLPFYEKVAMVDKILCHGDKDFIYSVHPSTMVVEATRSQAMTGDLNLSETQLSVLTLARPNISTWKPEYAQYVFASDAHVLTFPSPEQFRNGAFNDHAFSRIVATVQDDVLRSSRGLVCEDWDKVEETVGMHVASRKIKEATHGAHNSCATLDLLWCSDMNAHAVRALCPLTCGCSNIHDPAAGFFASPAWGCPMKCYSRIKASIGFWDSLGSPTPCEDVPAAEFSTRSSLKNYVRGFYSYFLNLMESGGISISMKIEVGDLHKQLGIRRRNINSTAASILDGTFLLDIISGSWQFAPKVPHPRGLQGCAFWTSWEVGMVFGTDLCNTDDFRSIRMFCPVSCKCKAEDDECPLSCPQR